MKLIAGLVLALLLLGAGASIAAPPSAEPEDSLTRLPPDAPPSLAPPLTAPALQPPAPAPLAQPKQVTIGDTTLTLPPLDGFQELYGNNKSFDGIVDQFVQDGNHMLAVYISDADIATMKADPQAGFKRYILVQTRNQDMHIKTGADFDAIRDAVTKGVGAGPLENSPEVIDQVSKATGYMHDQFDKDLQIKLGETKFLGKFVDSREALSYLLATNYGVTTKDGTQSFPIVVAMSVLAVKERPLFICTYSSYAGGADIDFVTQNTKKFLDRVFTANGGAPGQAVAGSSAEPGQPAPAELAKEQAVDGKDRAGKTAVGNEVADKDAKFDPAADVIEWTTWAAIVVALIVGAALAGPKIFKKLGEKDESL